MMTGRRGLWLFGAQEQALILAAHPNDDQQILIYPPLGKDALKLLPRLRTLEAFRGKLFKLARFGAQDLTVLEEQFAKASRWHQGEDVLDWQFPSHTLSVDALVSASGPDFRDFRKNLNRAKRRDVQVRTLDPVTDRAALSILWHRVMETDESALETCLGLMRSQPEHVKGLVLELPSVGLVGFTIWENTNAVLANGLLNLAETGFKGVSEYSFFTACQEMKKVGIEQFCIGGSETAGLDQFKRKMNPIQSLQLHSILLPPSLQPAPGLRRANNDVVASQSYFQCSR